MFDNVNVSLTMRGAKVPARQNPFDAGADLFAPYDDIVEPHSHILMDLGVCLELEQGTVAYIFARSSLGSIYGIRPRNCVGIIDAKYRDSLKIMIENSSDIPFYIGAGDRIAQLIISPVFIPSFTLVDEVNKDGDRGGGFGSTGR